MARAIDYSPAHHLGPMRASTPLSELEGRSRRLVLIPKGTLVANDRTGRTGRSRKAQLVTTFACAQEKVTWQLGSAYDYADAPLAGVVCYDPEHQHAISTHSSISGHSPIRGGGTYRKTAASCECGWHSRGNYSAKEAREAYAEHLFATAQYCAWMSVADLVLEVPHAYAWRALAGGLQGALEHAAALDAWQRPGLSIRAQRPDLLGRPLTLIGFGDLPPYLQGEQS